MYTYIYTYVYMLQGDPQINFVDLATQINKVYIYTYVYLCIYVILYCGIEEAMYLRVYVCMCVYEGRYEFMNASVRVYMCVCVHV